MQLTTIDRKRLFPKMIALAIVFIFVSCDANEYQDRNIHEVPSDLVVPEVLDGPPAAGSRFWHRLPEYENWDVAHAVYLPSDWQPDQRYPVIFEYPGNGGFRNELGDRSDGRVEDCLLGYGLTEGKGVIWVSLPFVDKVKKQHSIRWWGDAEETVKYCKLAAQQVCDEFGGDPERLMLAGFSRGAIACNFIGLWDDEIASLWCAFFPNSHYDGVFVWNYAGSDRASAKTRLSRLNNRPQWISHELSVDDVREYIDETDIEAPFHFETIPYPNHSATWVLKDIPLRAKAQAWVRDVFAP